MDIDSISPGSTFADVIAETLSRCHVMLAVIGPDWVNAKDQSGKRRLLDPQDFVALELKTALERKILVIPLLVGGATMPRPTQLPSRIMALTQLQAFSISDAHWRRDIQDLDEVLTNVEQFHIARILKPGLAATHILWAIKGPDGVAHMLDYSVDEGGIATLDGVVLPPDPPAPRKAEFFFKSRSWEFNLYGQTGTLHVPPSGGGLRFIKISIGAVTHDEVVP
jgi:hypothetical protein